MTGHNQRSYADEHDEGREKDSPAVGRQHRTTVDCLVNSSLGHAEGVVIALSKDERGEDDVDDIERKARDTHNSLNP